MKKDLEVKDGISDLTTNPKDYVFNDPIVYQFKGERNVGKISNVYTENDVTKLDIAFKNGETLKVKANDPNVQALFFKNAQERKTYTRFSYQEVVGLIKDNKFANLNYEALGKTNVNNMILGGKTSVIENVQLEKKEPKEVFNVAVRFQVYEKNNQLSVNTDIRQRELNLDNKVLGRELSPVEKKQLGDTNELGLIDNFVNTKSGEISKKWVSVDLGLNKVVTRPENSVYLDKIFGAVPTKAEKAKLEKGEAVLMNFTKKDKTKYKMLVQISAASTSLNGIKTYSEAKAKELGLLNDDTKAQKKKGSGVKI